MFTGVSIAHSGRLSLSFSSVSASLQLVERLDQFCLPPRQFSLQFSVVLLFLEDVNAEFHELLGAGNWFARLDFSASEEVGRDEQLVRMLGDRLL